MTTGSQNIKTLVMESLERTRTRCGELKMREAGYSNDDLIELVADYGESQIETVDTDPMIRHEVGYLQGLADGLDMTLRELWDEVGA
jgi:hypothetical protein